MKSIAKMGGTLCAALLMVATQARADDAVYVGTSTVQAAGALPAVCVPQDMKISITGDRFSYSNGGAPIAVGALKTDGTLSASYSVDAGTRAAARSVQYTLEGHIDAGKATGTLSGANGCVRSFALTKQ